MTISVLTDGFTRPANTTQYTAGDMVAQDVDAADETTTPSLVFPLSGVRSSGGKITGATLEKSSATVTVATFALHIFDRTKTVTSGDNAALAVADNAGYIGTLLFDMTTAANNVAIAGGPIIKAASALVGSLAFPVRRNNLYGLLQATGAYAPASGEIFTVKLNIES